MPYGQHKVTTSLRAHTAHIQQAHKKKSDGLSSLHNGNFPAALLREDGMPAAHSLVGGLYQLCPVSLALFIHDLGAYLDTANEGVWAKPVERNIRFCSSL